MCWRWTATPAHQKVFQDVSFIGRRKLLATTFAVQRSTTRLGRGRHTDNLVSGPTFRACEILVSQAHVHGVFMRKTEGVQSSQSQTVADAMCLGSPLLGCLLVGGSGEIDELGQLSQVDTPHDHLLLNFFL